MLVVDAANVVGSRPDGWWRDRAGAADRLIAQIRDALNAQRLHGPVSVVLEGRARRAAAPQEAEGGDLVVIRAPGSGDDRIAQLVAEATAEATEGADVVVVTADRGLMARVEALGAGVERPSRFLARLTPDSCDSCD